MVQVLVTGSRGCIGSATATALVADGHVLRRLVHGRADRAGEVTWDGHDQTVDPALLSGCGAIVHLAGAPVARRWTTRVRAEIRDSRVLATRALAEAATRAVVRPEVLIVASAIGYYGDRAEVVLTEETSTGTGFLAEVCRDWEAAAEPARQAGIRVVHLRFGLVLSPEGGALQRMRPAFRAGLGGRLGSGQQWWSWIHRDDVVAAIRLVLTDPSLSGPINVVAPQPVRQGDFAGILADHLQRPCWLPMPRAMVGLAFGAMGREIFLSSQRVHPAVLQQRGFPWAYPDLAGALAAC